MARETEQLSVSIEHSQREWLEKQVEQADDPVTASRSQIVRKAIEHYRQQQETDLEATVEP